MTPKKMGRPISQNPLGERITIRLDKDTSEKLDQYSRETGIPKPSIIRQILTDFLKNRK